MTAGRGGNAPLLAGLAAVVCGCGPSHAAPGAAGTARSAPASSADATPTVLPQASPPGSPTGAAAGAATLAQDLRFSWRPGFTRPAWLPPRILTAPPAPRTGAAACGVNPTGQYTALVRYSPQSAAAEVTIQINGYAGPGTYANSATATPVDVEVSPPQASQTGLSGFEDASATVTVRGDGTSGTVTSALRAGGTQAGTITGSWRCA